MAHSSPNNHIAWNAVLLAAVAAGCGWLLYSRAGDRAALAEGAQNLGRNLKQRFDGVGTLAEGVAARVRRVTPGSPPPTVKPRKITVDEPMAGYGA